MIIENRIMCHDELIPIPINDDRTSPFGLYSGLSVFVLWRMWDYKFITFTFTSSVQREL